MIKNGTLKMEDILKDMNLNKTQYDDSTENNISQEEPKKEETKTDDL
jgi:hypothetical protein